MHDQQGNFRIVTVSITIDLTKQDGSAVSDAELQTLATHELGHALGLDHTTFNPDDLMNPVPKVVFPSTLNLYAVYLLSMATNVKDLPQQAVALPANMLGFVPLIGAALTFMMLIQQRKWVVRWNRRIQLLKEYDKVKDFNRFSSKETGFLTWPLEIMFPSLMTGVGSGLLVYAVLLFAG